MAQLGRVLFGQELSGFLGNLSPQIITVPEVCQSPGHYVCGGLMATKYEGELRALVEERPGMRLGFA